MLFIDACKLVSQYAGRSGLCPSAEEVKTFLIRVMQQLLHSGAESGVRKITINSHKGWIVFPPEVEVALKVKIGHQVTEVWNKWYSFHSAAENFDNCYEASRVLIEDGTMTPVANPLPAGGSVVGIMGHCQEDDDAYVLIQGKDSTGREVYTDHDGVRTPGEKFKIANNEIRYGQVVWGEITGVVKSKTNSYVSIHAVDPASGKSSFLGDWSPSEERPSYRRYKVIAPECAGKNVRLSILCRIKLKDSYHEKDIIPFDNTLALILAAQRIQAEVNDNLEVANYKKQALDDVLEREAGYKKLSGGVVDVYFPLSGGAIRNII